MSAVCTTCPYCGVGCGVLATPDGVTGDPDHPANFGRLCSKGSALGETIDLEGRLLRPEVDGEPASWDTAIGRIANAFSDAIAEHGPDSVAFYVSGQLLTEDYYVANKLMKGYIGSANIDTNSRLCMASSVAGHRRAFGTDTVPGTYEDIEEADLVVLVGSNLAWCHPVLYQRLMAAKEARPGLRVINIDPRRTATTDGAEMHLQIAPDGDAALFNALLAEIDRRGAVDESYVAEHVTGIAGAMEAAYASDPTSTGLSEDEVNAFCDAWIGAEKVVTIYSQGVNQSVVGTDKVNSILNCHLATGRIGRPGMGPFSVTGQPNAMGGREVGGLANMLACHLDIENPDHRRAVQADWNSPAMASAPGLKAVDLFRACEAGKIKALWVMSTNPAVSMPEAARVARAIQNVPFVAVTDILGDTDTGRLAHVQLPAAAWGEKSGTVTNSERRISRQRAFLPVPGEARADWQIICDVAKAMGFEGFDFASEAEVFREYAAQSRLARDIGRDFDISGLAALSDKDYHALEPVQWPVPEQGTSGGRFFANGGFYHADGKARMLPISAPEVPGQSPGFFCLNSGRIRDHWHTMTRTGKAPRLSQHLAEPYLEVHPEDAVALGLRGADLARVSGEAEIALFRVMLSDKVRRGEVFAPMHWTVRTAPAGRVNPVIGGRTDPFSGQPALKAGHVQITRYVPEAYGFVAAVTEVADGPDYLSRSRMNAGWQAELAWTTAPEDWEAELRRLTGLTDGRASVMADSGSGRARVALFDGERVAAVMFIAREPVALARRHVAGLVGQEVSAAEALAGWPGADRPDPGATVCSCFEVGVNTLKTAISDGSSSVEALGVSTCAGTNCGSCKPELAALIAAHAAPVAAE